MLRAGAGAVTALAVAHALDRELPGGSERWRRTNYRGQPVSLSAGPALAVAVSAAAGGPAAVVAGVGAGLAGRHDDVHAGADETKGFRGHLGAARRGRLTTGATKLLGISATGLLAAALVRPRRDAVLAGAVIAGTANLVNLLDLRPGRALKVGVAGGVLLGRPGIAGGCAALLPGDLGERRMLGDCGANALGAVLGVALLERVRSRIARQLVLVVLVGLTAASERVSFSAVIERTPSLRRLDQLGRRP